MIAALIGLTSTVIWVYLMVGRGFFWRSDIRDDDYVPAPAAWPPVLALIPARNEAESIARVVETLALQDYAGDLTIMIVDDESSDGTADIARAAALRMGIVERLAIVRGRPPAGGWTGKLNALQQGYEANASMPTRYLWLTDADIAYTPDALSSLVRRAEAGGLVLTSLMAKLRCESFAEKLLVPAFIFFFEMLYPFAWVNRADHPLGAAAGGCMLVRREALERIGGFASIRGALIDDCALGARLKTVGPIWLGLTERALSLRAYPTIEDIRRMVARSAYAQLGYSPAKLAGTVLGMLLVYAAPPLLALFAGGGVALNGLVVWLMMAVAFEATARFYRIPPFSGLALPVIALFYLAFTLDSAYQHAQGRGGLWKGRVQAARS